MHLLAYNFVNLDPNGDLQSSTVTTGLAMFGDLQPIWQLFISLALVAIVISILMVAIHPGK